MNIIQTPIVATQPKEVPPVYLRSVKIKNVKSFRDEVKISFLNKQQRAAQWTVIVGENGTGKTTLLQCLAGMSASPGVQKLPDKEAQQAVVQPLFAGQQWLDWQRARLNDDTLASECFVELDVGGLLSSGPSGETVPWKHGLQTAPLPGQQLQVTMTTVAAEPSKMAGFVLYAYGAGRRMAITSRTPYDPSTMDGMRTLFDDDRPLMNAEEWLLELDHLAKTDHDKQQRAIKELEQVRQVLINVLPEIDNIESQIEEMTPRKEAKVRVRFRHSCGTWLGVESLSFGYQTMTSWVVDLTRRLYQRYPESENPIAEPAIVLLDEIDLHLHPKWQQSVMDFLSERFINTQFIVTAHSPLVLQSHEAVNIVLLQRDGNNVRARQDLDSIKQWRIDQIFVSDLFGLDRVRPPEVESLYDERSSLLAKSKLTNDDENRLKELNAKIHSLPTAETKEMRDVEDLLRKVAKEHLEKNPRS